MFKFFKNWKKKPHDEYFLALDIGTEFVKALVYKVVESRAEIHGVGRVRQKLGDMQGGAITDIAGVIQNCKKAITEAEEMAKAKVSRVIMGIAGELVKGSTTTVHYERTTPTSQITLSELKNIVHRVQWKSFDQVRSQLAWETGFPEIDVKLVNAAVVDVKIDGYRITNPLGFQGKDVTIAIFNAFAPLVHLGALQTVAEELNLEVMAISAEPYAVARAVKQDDEHLSAIFIDIGGGTTDLAVVRDGGVEGTKMFALGGRSFTKRLSQVLSVSFTEAENIKLAYSRGRLDRVSTAKVMRAIESDIEVWISGIELTLVDFYNLDFLPAKIYLCGGGAGLPEIKEALETHKWSDQIPFTQRPVVEIIAPADVTYVVDQTGCLENYQDITPMSLASLGMSLEVKEEAVVARILSKVAKLMQV